MEVNLDEKPKVGSLRPMLATTLVDAVEEACVTKFQKIDEEGTPHFRDVNKENSPEILNKVSGEIELNSEKSTNMWEPEIQPTVEKVSFSEITDIL